MKPLFDPGQTVAGGRICLSELSPDLLTAMPWLPDAAAPEYPLNGLHATATRGYGALIADAEGAPIGIALAQPGPAHGAITIPFLAIDPARRFRGLGGEAGLAFERHIRTRCAVDRIYAPVPEARGLAVYFWLRLGYRPLSAVEAPHATIGVDATAPGIWMLRDAG